MEKPSKGRMTSSHLDHLATLGADELATMAVEAEARLMEMTVTRQTYHLYDLRVRLLDRILDSLNAARVVAGTEPVAWDRSLFILLLQTMHGTGLARSCTGYLNAILFFQRSGIWGSWALHEQELLHRLCKGAVYDRGDARHRTVRGQMDGPMFENFIEYMVQERKPASMILAVKVCFSLALRVSELVRLRHEQIIIGVEGDIEIDLPNKMFRAKNPTAPPRIRKPVVEWTTVDILLALRQKKGTGDFLFPPGIWNEKSLRDTIKSWAGEHALQFLESGLDNVFFDGPHVLRHGGMAALQEKVIAAMGDAMKGGLGGCSSGNVNFYARPNVNRGGPKRTRD